MRLHTIVLFLLSVIGMTVLFVFFVFGSLFVAHDEMRDENGYQLVENVEAMRPDTSNEKGAGYAVTSGSGKNVDPKTGLRNPRESREMVVFPDDRG